MKKQDKGFTLVELLIVIVILGILATVTVFAVRGITDTGQQNACDVEQRTLSTAIEAYYAQNQSDPASAQALVDGGLLPSAPSVDDWTFNVAVAGTPGDPTATPPVPATAGTPASFTVTADGKCDV